MKICFLTTSYPYSKNESRGSFIYKFVIALEKYVRLDIVSVDSYGSFIKDAGILPNLRRSWRARFLSAVVGIRFYFKIIKNAKKCDLIHANWMPTALLAIFSKPIHRKRIILTERNPYLVSTNNKFWMLINGFVFRNVNKLILISNDSKRKIESKYNIKNIKVITNGVEPIKISNKNILRKKLNLPKKSKILIYAGRLTDVKGIEYLIQAFSKLNTKHKNLLLLIVGYGENLEKLREMANKLNVNNKILFTDKVPHNTVFEYMQASDIFVLPSLDETGGNVQLEARNCGLPLIATKVGWAEDLIKNGEDGFFINKEDSDDIYKKLDYMLSNKNTLKKITENSKKVKLKSWDECAREYLEEYTKLLER